jgi:sugar O-acyltransferase (sialic acid O-acetyltransferase NeuD family)
MKKLAIAGSKDLAQLIAYHAENDKHYKVAGFFDDYEQPGNICGNYPVLGSINDIQRFYDEGVFDELLIGIGYKYFQFRKNFWGRFNGKIPFGNLIHSSCYVDPSCTLGQGIVMLPGSTLDMNVTIGNNVLLNTGCIIAHDSVIEDHVFLSPGVKIAGFVNIGQASFIGIGSIIIDNIKICDETQTGGGTVVVKNIQAPGLYVGNPARFIR